MNTWFAAEFTEFVFNDPPVDGPIKAPIAPASAIQEPLSRHDPSTQARARSDRRLTVPVCRFTSYHHSPGLSSPAELSADGRPQQRSSSLTGPTSAGNLKVNHSRPVVVDPEHVFGPERARSELAVRRRCVSFRTMPPWAMSLGGAWPSCDPDPHPGGFGHRAIERSRKTGSSGSTALSICSEQLAVHRGNYSDVICGSCVYCRSSSAPVIVASWRPVFVATRSRLGSRNGPGWC